MGEQLQARWGLGMSACRCETHACAILQFALARVQAHASYGTLVALRSLSLRQTILQRCLEQKAF